MVYKLAFKENLRRLRIEKGMTQTQLAQKLGVDQRTISAWEKGVCEPSLSIVLTLCEIFDETLEGLLTDSL